MSSVRNATRSTVIAHQAHVADTFFSRMAGLLGRRSLPKKEALIITRCQSIHMFFMRFAIDAIFVDRNNQVVGLVQGIKPFRLSPIFFRASFVVELPEGSIVQSNTSLGDKIEIKED